MPSDRGHDASADEPGRQQTLRLGGGPGWAPAWLTGSRQPRLGAGERPGGLDEAATAKASGPGLLSKLRPDREGLRPTLGIPSLMKVSSIPDDVDGVQGLSPLIGILLMALITLLIAAILGTFIVA